MRLVVFATQPTRHFAGLRGAEAGGETRVSFVMIFVSPSKPSSGRRKPVRHRLRRHQREPRPTRRPGSRIDFEDIAGNSWQDLFGWSCVSPSFCWASHPNATSASCLNEPGDDVERL